LHAVGGGDSGGQGASWEADFGGGNGFGSCSDSDSDGPLSCGMSEYHQGGECSWEDETLNAADLEDLPPASLASLYVATQENFSVDNAPYLYEDVLHGQPKTIGEAWQLFMADNASQFSWDKTVLPYVWIPVFLSTAYTASVVGLNHAGVVPHVQGGGITYAANLMSLLTAFRASSSYSRYWEGRSEWAKITGAISDLTTKGAAWINGEHLGEAGRDNAMLAKIEFARLLKIQLGAIVFRLQQQTDLSIAKRYGKGNGETSGFPFTVPAVLRDATDDERIAILTNKEDPPLLATLWLRKYIMKIANEELLGSGCPRMRSMMVQSLEEQVEVLWTRNAAPKITSTPFPQVYLHMIRLIRGFLLAFLPFAMADDMSWAAVPVVATVSLGLFGMDAVCTQLEDPFAVGNLDDFLKPGTIKAAFRKINYTLDPLAPPRPDPGFYTSEKSSKRLFRRPDT